MHRLGQLWAAGELSMASEHLATEVCKQRLLSMLQLTAPDAQAPLLLCACPQGEWHELGLLTYAYNMQCQGWQICYLGPNLPVREVLYGCQHLQPRRVALSLTYVDEISHGLSLVQEIEALIAATYPTFIGGQAVERFLHLLPLGQAHLPSYGLAQAALHD